MLVLHTLIILGSILSGLFSGIALQKSLVELPARKKTGAIIFAKYARASDLGNGIYLYPACAILGAIITISAFVVAMQSVAALSVTIALGAASAFSIGVLVMTLFAAPQMLKIGKTGDEEMALANLLNKFANYSLPRTVFICLQFAALFFALILM
jgi:hypothetical protein